MACDLCGKVADNLVKANPDFTPPAIQYLCNECERRATKRLYSIRRLTRKRMIAWYKRQIRNKTNNDRQT